MERVVNVGWVFQPAHFSNLLYTTLPPVPLFSWWKSLCWLTSLASHLSIVLNTPLWKPGHSYTDAAFLFPHLFTSFINIFRLFLSSHHIKNLVCGESIWCECWKHDCCHEHSEWYQLITHAGSWTCGFAILKSFTKTKNKMVAAYTWRFYFRKCVKMEDR